MYGDTEEGLSRYHRLLLKLVKSLDNVIGSGWIVLRYLVATTSTCSVWPALENTQDAGGLQVQSHLWGFGR